MLLEHGVPYFKIFQRTFLGNIVYHDSAVCVFHIVGDEASEALLTGRIPELNTVVFAVASDVFDVEVDADGGLRVGMGTFNPSSNLSLIYFSMMEDLPTDWSPRKIILYLVRPPPTVLDETLINIKIN